MADCADTDYVSEMEELQRLRSIIIDVIERVDASLSEHGTSSTVDVGPLYYALAVVQDAIDDSASEEL